MAIEMRQQMKMTQQLVMTPQLQQAIKLLQLSRLELQDVIRQEIEENPLLDESPDGEEPREEDPVERNEAEVAEEAAPQGDEFEEVRAGSDTLTSIDWDTYLDGYNYSTGETYHDDEDRPSFESMLTKKASLFDHLLWQLNMGRFSEEELRIGMEIIGNLDDDGYLRLPLTEIAMNCQVSEPTVEGVLRRIQEFDPSGVAARDLRECLLIQVRQLGMERSLVEELVRNHLRDLESRKFRQLAKDHGVEIDDIVLASKVIAGLDPKPGRLFGGDDVQYIIPDIFVYKLNEEYVVVLNDDGLPHLRITPTYADEARQSRNYDSKTEEFIIEKKRSALWLIKSIHQRQRTIYRVARSIVKFQREFLDRGIGYLRPLVLRDVADDIGMHESTISRVTTNKYMQTPQGLFELKYFFNSGLPAGNGDFVASETVKTRIKELIDAEDPKRPLSDQQIADILSKDGVTIARRTVTKYREVLKLGSSSERKRYY
ncbi:MAG: RNA polymerase factor sigma-54 [Desulfuromonadia bacterium]